MVIAEVVNLITDNLQYFLWSLGAAVLLSGALSYFFIRKLISGMVVSQITFSFNFAVIFFLFVMGYLGYGDLFQFSAIELLVTSSMFLIYRKVLKNRDYLMKRVGEFSGGRVAVPVVFSFLILTAINQFFVPKDGGSRIGYMILWWFSYVRLLVSIVMPLGYFLAINFLESRRYLLSFALMVVMVLQNATSGSKAGFIVGLFGMLMLHRDLNGGRIKVIRFNPLWAAFIAAFTSASVVMILRRLGTTYWDILYRLIMHAEATIMVYLSPNHTEACQGVTLFAALHRGVARLFKDPSATDIDTLFGFALSAIHYGANTLTGPNSSIPAYFACNFPGWRLPAGLFAIACYVLLVTFVFNRWILGKQSNSIWLLPFLVASVNTFPQDYYSGMSHLTIMTIISLYYILVRRFALHA